MTLSKLKDKTTIDGQVKVVNLLFSDHLGRMHSLKLDAEHFLEHPEGSFEFS